MGPASCAPRSRDDMIHTDMPTMAPIATRMSEMARAMYSQPRDRFDSFTLPRILRSESPISICATMSEIEVGVSVSPSERASIRSHYVATEWVTRLGACVFDLKFYFCQ